MSGLSVCEGRAAPSPQSRHASVAWTPRCVTTVFTGSCPVRVWRSLRSSFSVGRRHELSRILFCWCVRPPRRGCSARTGRSDGDRGRRHVQRRTLRRDGRVRPGLAITAPSGAVPRTRPLGRDTLSRLFRQLDPGAFGQASHLFMAAFAGAVAANGASTATRSGRISGSEGCRRCSVPRGSIHPSGSGRMPSPMLPLPSLPHQRPASNRRFV